MSSEQDSRPVRHPIHSSFIRSPPSARVQSPTTPRLAQILVLDSRGFRAPADSRKRRAETGEYQVKRNCPIVTDVLARPQAWQCSNCFTHGVTVANPTPRQFPQPLSSLPLAGGAPASRRKKSKACLAHLDSRSFIMASSYLKPKEKTLQNLRDIASRLRIHSIRATCASNSG